MQSQYAVELAIPLPPHISAQFALEYLQTNGPALTEVGEDPVSSELPPDPTLIANDPFFGPWDQRTRAVNTAGYVALAAGLRRAATWCSIYQDIPDGIKFRTVTNTGVSSWTTWTIRMRQDGRIGGTDSEVSSPESNVEGWELCGKVIIQTNKFLMPFVSLFLRRTVQQLGERIIGSFVNHNSP